MSVALSGFVLILLTMCGLVVWRFAGLPLQPARAATARVAAIVPEDSRFHANVDRIYLRNSHGEGHFALSFSDNHCRVGDEVRVEQRGSTLAPLPETCKRP